MNAEAIIAAIMANLDDYDELVKRAESVEVPSISNRANEAFKKKYALLGQALAHKKMSEFVDKLNQAIQNAKEQAKQNSEASQTSQTPQESKIDETQYKHGSTFHLRNQTSFPSGLTYTRSFGGDVAQQRKNGKPSRKRKRKRIRKENLNNKLLNAFATINEELAHAHDNVVLKADEGQFIIDGENTITNHADILKALFIWLIDNRPEVLNSAMLGIADMLDRGTILSNMEPDTNE